MAGCGCGCADRAHTLALGHGAQRTTELDDSKKHPYLGTVWSGPISPDQKTGLYVAARADVVHRTARHYKKTQRHLGKMERGQRWYRVG